MTRRFLRLALLLAAVACALLMGCGLGLEPVVQLVTDRAEIAAYVDRFNAVQSDVKVEISYQESPAQAVVDGVAGDVVVGEWLASPAVMDRLDGLGDLVKPGKIDPAWFYAHLLAMGYRDNRPILVPLSFTLPAIVYLKTSDDLQSMFMPLDTLREKSAAFTKLGKSGALTAVGFSPEWNQDTISAVSLLLGARFHGSRNGQLVWDESGLNKTVGFMQAWFSGVAGAAAADKAFYDRTVLVQPWYKLLSPPPAKTLFALVPFTDFIALPEEKRRDFDFRWLSQDGQIPVADDVLFAGVLRSSRNKAGARAFLQWFCSLPVQESLLAVNQSRRIGVFGVTNGFSALKAINDRDLPQKYPLLLGHVPQEPLLVFPEMQPDNWQRLREVVGSWIVLSAAVDPRSPAPTLEATLADWVKAQKK